MSTTTTRLGLVKPAGTENYDITIFDANFDKTDAAVGALVVTSSTRPSVPFSGQLIRETDTGKTWVREGAAWADLALVRSVTSGTRPSSPAVNDRIYETDTLFLRRWDGTGWVFAGSNADPDTTTASAGHTPVYTASTTSQSITHNTTTTLSGWTTTRNDTAVLTYSAGVFTIVERGVHAIVASVSSDSAATGRSSVTLNVPGGATQTFPTGHLIQTGQRATGYSGAGALDQALSWTGFCEAGWTFSYSVFQFSSTAVTNLYGGIVSATRLPS